MNIIKGKQYKAQKVCVYGPEGVGKSTFASQFPDPLFIDTEDSTVNMDVNRFQKPSSWTMLLQQIAYVKANPGMCKTLIVDTADWAERLCSEHICSKATMKGIEDFGYGKGYIYLEEEFGRFLNQLQEIIEIGINVVVTAHAEIKKIEQPEEIGGYDHWQVKLEKKTMHLLKEWSDILLLANYKVHVVNVDNQGAQKGKNKAQGGKRVMYTTHTPWWDAKNRHNLPDELPFEFKAIAHCIPILGNANDKPATTEAKSTPPPRVAGSSKEETFQQPPMERTGEPDKANAKAEEKQEKTTLQGVPKSLSDLMQAKDVTIEEVQEIVTLRGYYPKGTSIANYDPAFINGVLVGAWDKVYGMIREQKISRGEFISTEGEEIAFN